MAENSTPIIPDYELFSRIGRGSYGEVWLARSVTGVYRAVKIVYRNSFDHDRPYDREFAGIKAFEPISRSSDTQVDILHVGRNDAKGYFYYVMELADDQKSGSAINPADYSPRTLRNELHKLGRLPIAECLEIGIQLTTALEHLHGSGLIHRDVKPSNIVFVLGVPKLADVGLVTASDSTRSFVGTEGYIPRDGSGTPQADLFSLGKVLYEISTGHDRLDFPELPTNLKDHPERESLVQLNEVILKACEDDGKLRYQSAGEMLSDLLAVKAGQPIARSKPKAWWTILTGIIVIAVLLMAMWHLQPHKLKGVRVEIPVPTIPTTPPNLVCWLKADGNASDSAGTSNGQLQEGVTYGQGKDGQAFFLNGKNACISIPNNHAWISGTNEFSITVWAKCSAMPPLQTLLASENVYENASKWSFCLHHGKLQWHMVENGQSVWLGSTNFVPIVGQWYHLAVTRKGNHFCFFVNGIKLASENWPGKVPDTGAPITIGNAWGGYGFNGLLEDIRIYNRAILPLEIKNMGMVATKSFDEVLTIGNRKYARREFPINTSFGGTTSQVNLALLANGNFLATWHQGLHWHCYGQVFNPIGDPIGSTFLLNNSEENGWQWGPSPAAMPDGGFVMTWGDEFNETNRYSAVQRFDSFGVPVSSIVHSDLPDWTSTASFTNGDFVAVGSWAVGPLWVRDDKILARRFHADGSPYGPVFKVSELTNGYSTAASTYGTDGRFAFAWASHTRNAMVRAYHSNEFSPFGPEFPVNTSAPCDGKVNACYNSGNNLVVVWRSAGNGLFSNSVCVRRFDANLLPLAGEQKVNEAKPANDTDTSLSVGPNDEALISWGSYTGKNSKDIYARLLDQNGDVVGHEFRVNQFTKGNHILGWEDCLHTLILQNGNFVVGWMGEGANGSGLYLTMFRRIDKP